MNQNRRILIIEDERTMQEAMRFALGGRAFRKPAVEAAPNPALAWRGFQIDTVSNGQEAALRMQKALGEDQPYAMAFVDLNLEGDWSGFETIRHLWELHPDLQVAIVTGQHDFAWTDLVAELGCSDQVIVLKKPFEAIEVQQLAEALCRKWGFHQQEKQQMEELERQVNHRTAELKKAVEQLQQEIAERKWIEENLHKSEERFRSITENAVDLITIMDHEGRRSYVSHSCQRDLGFTLQELYRIHAFDQIHPEDRERVVQAMHTAFETGGVNLLEYRVEHKDGSWRVLECHGSVIQDSQGSPEKLLTVSRDVTERKKEEMERQMMEVQLRHAQKLESIGSLAAGIAHEINTPTQYIGDNIRFLHDAFKDMSRLISAYEIMAQAVVRQEPIADLQASLENVRRDTDWDYLRVEIPRSIEQSIEGVGRVSKIVRAMKEFSHPGSEEKTALDLNKAIESTLTVARNEWKYISEMETDFDPNLPLVPCLPGEFNQVVLNIVINATHAIADVVGDGSRGKGKIKVSTLKIEDWVEIRISDTGSGIPEQCRSKIFEPFFTTKTVGKGTGQGLAIARSVVVDKHAGMIDFETETGKGTTFIIRLPLNPPPVSKKRKES